MAVSVKGLYRQCLRELPKAKTRYSVPFDTAAMRKMLKQNFVNQGAGLDPALTRPLVAKALRDLEEIQMNWKTRTEVLHLLKPIKEHHFDADFESEEDVDRDLMKRFYAQGKDHPDSFLKHSK